MQEKITECRPFPRMSRKNKGINSTGITKHLVQLVAGLSDVQSNYKPNDQTWSTNQSVEHVSFVQFRGFVRGFVDVHETPKVNVPSRLSPKIESDRTASYRLRGEMGRMESSG